MNTQGHEAGQQPRERRVWDLLASVENHPQVAAWLAEAPAPGRGSRRIWAIAAGLVLVFGALAATLSLLFSGTHYETQVGEQRDISLPDGSRITLNTDTALTVRYSDRRRFIDIQRGRRCSPSSVTSIGRST